MTTLYSDYFGREFTDDSIAEAHATGVAAKENGEDARPTQFGDGDEAGWVAYMAGYNGHEFNVFQIVASVTEAD